MGGIVDRYKGVWQVTCKEYQALPDSRRCGHYGQGGTCALPGIGTCTEWQKRTQQAATIRAAETLLPRPEPAASCPGCPELLALRRLTDEDIASFKALGVQVCIQTESLGELWIVPRYTGQDRFELIPEHAAMIAAIVGAFPGAKLTQFIPEARTSPATETTDVP